MIEIGGGDSRGAKSYSVDEIGVKAANLARMAALGLPVPPAFVLPVSFCEAIAKGGQKTDQELKDALRGGVAFLEKTTGKCFGDRRRPLLLSVRSGAARSMPGMLATVLNVGCTSAATHGLIRMTGNPRFAWDTRRRFIESYTETTLGLDPKLLAPRWNEIFSDESAETDTDLDCEALERLASAYETVIAEAGKEIEDDPMAQLGEAVRAVYRSWTSERARTYRNLEKLDNLPGTAVAVQAMVFGNLNLRSASGVAFSRNPSTGVPQPMIDVLFDAQGEDVVSGCRTPQTEAAIGRTLPKVGVELASILSRLEHEFRDVQDLEFTIEDGRLWILQTRNAKRTPRAALRIAIDLVQEGLITEQEAFERLSQLDLEGLAITRFADPGPPIARGTGAGGGVAVGRAAFDSRAAEKMAASGDAVVLMRPDISTADVAGIAAAAGLVTATGGRTAHAALVARQKGKPCVVGCADLTLDAPARRATLVGAVIEEGDWISIDGESGRIFSGQREVVRERPEAELDIVAGWRVASELAAVK